MAEIRFYHLTETPLERALPMMLERTLERGQRAIVRGVHAERLRFMDGLLWTADDTSFLPHGIDSDPDPDQHPVWLTTATDNPNAANVLFLVDGADAPTDEMAALETTAILFDGHDPAAVEAARGQWRTVTTGGLAAVYWAQDGGRWVKKHEAKPD